MTAALVGLYLGAIVLANFISAHFGAKASIVNAAALIGLDMTTRDRLHDFWHVHRWRKMAVLILAGSTISYLASLAISSSSLPSSIVARIALASAVAFLVAETLDAVAYHLLRHQQWLERSNKSNLVSAVVDSVVFVSIAFGFDWQIVFGQICAKVAGGFVWSLILARRRRQPVPSPTAI